MVGDSDRICPEAKDIRSDHVTAGGAFAWEVHDTVRGVPHSHAVGKIVVAEAIEVKHGPAFEVHSIKFKQGIDFFHRFIG